MAKIIAVCNHKGGVAKTTTAVNVAAGLAKRKVRVLLIDMDAQANLTDALRIEDTKENIYNVMKYGDAIKPVHVRDYIDAVPAVLDLASAEVELNAKIGREHLLQQALEPVADKYDCIILDCPPSLGLLTMNAFTAADYVVIPIRAEYFALKGIQKLAEVVESVKKYVNPHLRIGGIIITQFNIRTILHRQIRDVMEQQYGRLVFRIPVRNCIAVAEAQAKGTDIFTYAADSTGAEDYEAVVREWADKFNL